MQDIFELDHEELVTQGAALLPAREALALVNIADVFASNSSTAANVATVNSLASSAALQSVSVSQS